MKPAAKSSKSVQTTEVKQLFYISIGLLALALVLLVIALAVATNRESKIVVSPNEGYKVGVVVSQGNTSMKVNGVTFGGSQPGFKAPAGKHYAVIDFSVTNNVDKPINVLPSNDTYVKDSAGVVTYLTPYAVASPFRAGTLLPGETVRGQLSYLIASTGSVKLYVDGIWSGGVVPFKVQ